MDLTLFGIFFQTFLSSPDSKILSHKVEGLFILNYHLLIVSHLLSSLPLNLDIIKTFGEKIQIEQSSYTWKQMIIGIDFGLNFTAKWSQKDGSICLILSLRKRLKKGFIGEIINVCIFQCMY